MDVSIISHPMTAPDDGEGTDMRPDVSVIIPGHLDLFKTGPYQLRTTTQSRSLPKKQ